MLEQHVNEHLGRYSEEAIENVWELCKYVDGKQGKRINKSKYLLEIDDWELYFRMHPEWKGRSNYEMRQDKESGANAFQQAFYMWTVAKSTDTNGVVDRVGSNKLFHILFPNITKSWKHLVTINDWIEEFENHPEWQGRSTHQMGKDKESKANSFYQAFTIWTKKECTDSNGTLDNKSRIKLRKRLFPSVQRNWTHLTTIDDWVEKYRNHSEWVNMTPIKM